MNLSWTSIMRTLINRFTIPTTVILVLFLVKLMNPVFYDPDFYWHLKTGEYIVAHLSIPSTDPFSYTAESQRWVAHEWLTELILYGASALLGLTGIRIVVAAVLCATFIALFRFVKKMIGDDTRALILSMVFFAPLMPYGSPRPQIFSFLLFSVLLCILLEYKYFANTRKFFLVPALMLAWVNLHGAYVVGFALLLIFTATESLVYLHDVERDAERAKGLRKLIVMTALSAAVVNINPQGFGVWIHPFFLMAMDASKNLIVEWQSPNFHNAFYQYYLLLIIGFFVATSYCRKKPDLTEFSIPAFFIIAGIISQRHLPLTCFTLLLFSSALYNRISLPKLSQRWKGKSRLVHNMTRKQMNASLVPILNLLLVLVSATAVLSSEVAKRGSETLDNVFPVKATDYVVENNLKGRMFNEYGDGGYLIYRLAPQRKVFIDGRADMYGDSFIAEYIEISGGGPQWKEKFDKLNIDYVICGKSMPLRQLLLAEKSFKEVYSDRSHSVLVKERSGAIQQLAATSN
jgi:hypothetical protein